MVNPNGGHVAARIGGSKTFNMPRARRRIERLRQRPLYATVFIFSLLAVYCLFIRGPQPAPAPTSLHSRSLQRRAGEDCRLVHDADDKCAFVRRNCQDDEAGLIQYLQFYYCGLGGAKPLAFVVLMVWLGMLFTTIGIAASDFFSINLSTIATILGLSESLAGVTFLAFGNGSPDVFSTFAAMSSNSGSMAVGELIGAAGFITAVVAGSMALVREFKVMKSTFLRDVLFFLVAVSFTMVFLSDGDIYLWECLSMVIFYAFYVIFVVLWHAYEKRKDNRKAKEIASRSHYFLSGDGRSTDELEPYRDFPDEAADRPTEQRPPMHPMHASVDIGVLERGPRIDVEAPDKDEDYDRAQHIAAEMTSSMRVNRPRGARSNTTIAPIRPSLIGALEFRSVLASLQQEGNMHMRPLHHRSQSHDALSTPPGQVFSAPRVDFQAHEAAADALAAARSRALSSGNIPLSLDADLLQGQSPASRSRATSTHTVDGMLAPPLPDQPRGANPAEPATRDGGPSDPSATQLRLQIPSPMGSEFSSPATSPFPRFTDSPMIMTPHPEHPQLPRLDLPTPGLDDRPGFMSLSTPVERRPINWWPYHHLPAPHVLFNTLFPTLTDWQSKSIGSKLVSVLSVPSVLLLVITLPVVESETTDDDMGADITEHPASGHMGNVAPAVSFEPNAHIEHETEWQRYQRRRGATTSNISIPTLIEVDEPRSGQSSPRNIFPPLSNQVHAGKPASDIGPDSSNFADETGGWNRWLLIIQVFTGPLFCVVIVWANILEDLERPAMVLIRGIMGSLVVSLVLLGALLSLTSAERRPKYHFLFCFLGFCISIAWISTIAGEVVGVLKAFGVILNISEAILGLTVFAVGNSVGDLVADITVARLGYSVMALSACFGGPLLNILLGIGLGGAYQIVQSANKKHHKHPERTLEYKAYHIHVSGTLMISAITLLVTLVALLVVIPYNKWIMSRRIGIFLIALWSVSTITNLVVEITGAWQDVS
ncbi:Sodium/calcium exchanger protein-domain-containing protein [Microdochium trichocladiopsis]|uniref:Sodium/calcium exchanger protein-domain-containing protein n=1 Tax=Microdochium trichocladiopsis TaxID=1682393 RepID=A0A9P8YB75_9PEZI|nr:Sodium/calcium exchanger protein-domain-containing protein [Microdochium trichocladiopsis]KAH7035181.1 Sodium/calcium exchanger protein-domain-containing protein [Microdochium trichocladiopsis]